MNALLFGSTGTVVESARLERLAYNAAFDELGLDIYWNVATYCRLLELPGGPRRLDAVFGDELLAGPMGEVHELQQKHFERLASDGLQLRTGVAETIRFCADRNIQLGLVTTAHERMLDTLFRYTDGLEQSAFELILTRQDCAAEKPDPQVYRHALDTLRLRADSVVAVEDNPVHQAAALAADLQCYLFPGEYSRVDHDVLITRDLTQTVRRIHGLWAADTEYLQDVS